MDDVVDDALDHPATYSTIRWFWVLFVCLGFFVCLFALLCLVGFLFVFRCLFCVRWGHFTMEHWLA